MKNLSGALLGALMLAGASLAAPSPAAAQVDFGISFGDPDTAFQPCDYYDYYDEAPPWGLPEDYCDYPVYDEPVYFGGTWYRGPIYYRWNHGRRLFWLNGGWREDGWRGPRPGRITWSNRGGHFRGGFHSGGSWHGRDWHGRDWHGGSWHGGDWHGRDWRGGVGQHWHDNDRPQPRSGWGQDRGGWGSDHGGNRHDRDGGNGSHWGGGGNRFGGGGGENHGGGSHFGGDRGSSDHNNNSEHGGSYRDGGGNHGGGGHRH